MECRSDLRKLRGCLYTMFSSSRLNNEHFCDRIVFVHDQKSDDENVIFGDPTFKEITWTAK